MTKELEKAIRHIKTRADLWAVREVEKALEQEPTEKPMTVDVLEQIKAEIERLHYHPKLDFIKNDEVVDMALDIIDKYKAESEDT